MRLTNVTVRNFRSYVVGQNESSHKLELGSELNVLVGPNNCGKSNLLRAVALALGNVGGEGFDPALDRPTQLTWAYPIVSLSFEASGSRSVEKTLFKYLAEYEKSAGANKTHAEDGKFTLRVAYRSGNRDALFVVRDVATGKKGDPDKLRRALSQLAKSLRFIYLRSGDSLTNFLAGAFSELLHTVIGEHLKKQVTTAEQQRQDYLANLEKELLSKLGAHASDQLREVLSEIKAVKVLPNVPPLEKTLRQADILIEDTASTTLLHKGTGVRGAVVVALLAYLAKHSKRSLVFAIEEPECFLHPWAQQELLKDLGEVATREGVSLLMTTHSPFMLSRSPKTIITEVKKSTDGCTTLGKQIRGNDPHSPLVSSLFGESITASALDSVQPLLSETRGVLFVEGYTDKVFLEHAARVSGRDELLDGLEIRFDQGASKSALQALLLRQLSGDETPMCAVFDWDEHGKSAKSLLCDKFKWPKKRAFTYRQWCQKEPSTVPVEAEDLFHQRTLASFEAAHPDAIVEKMRFKDKTYHYGVAQEGKDEFVAFVRDKAKKNHVALLVTVLEDVRNSLGI